MKNELKTIDDCVRKLGEIGLVLDLAGYAGDAFDLRTIGAILMQHHWGREDDLPLPEDRAINDAHPLRNGNSETWAEAMRLVGAKRSKGALVELVNYLLGEIQAVNDAAEKRTEQAMRDKYAQMINDRVAVENKLWMIYHKKHPMPDREMCREWAIKLGIPKEYRNDVEQETPQ